MPSISYHCPCRPNSLPHPLSPHASSQFHPLSNLYFCEECDQLRCARCVSEEIACYYCPNCLFEVPPASVRAEQNRCARNCFLCPLCENSLSVNTTNPSEPVYHLQCNYCRYSSAEGGLVFEKPTGIALQLQRIQDTAPSTLEFEHLRDHYEPYFRHLPTPSSNPTTNKSLLAATSALHRDIPSIRTTSSAKPPKQSASKGALDALPDYKARGETKEEGGTSGPGWLSEDDLVSWLSVKEGLEGVVGLEARWTGGWRQSFRAKDLKPLRIPLRSKKTKRCTSCRHILIKPDQKAQSTRFKIKLLAASYLPTVEVSPKILAGRGVGRSRVSRISQAGAAVSTPGPPAPSLGEEGLAPGGHYTFQLAFTNPLFDPIDIHLDLIHPSFPNTENSTRQPYVITLPISSFAVSAFVDPWEYGDDSSGGEEDDVDLMLDPGHKRPTGSALLAHKKARVDTTVVERRGNVSKVPMVVQLDPHQASGDVYCILRVSFTYKSDEPVEDDAAPVSNREDESGPLEEGTKTFGFETLVRLGTVVVD